MKRWYLGLDNPLQSMLVIPKYKPVEAEKVARFMVKVAHQQPVSGVHVYETHLISSQYAITGKSIKEKTHGQSKNSIRKE
jgi:hypothetical protein